MIIKIISRSLIFCVLIVSSYQVIAQGDNASIGGLFEKNKIQSITVLDSSKIQVFLHDTVINGFDYLESEYSDSKIEMIRNRQIEIYDSIRIKPYYMSSSDSAYLISWIFPIFILLLLWTPGILAIIYFAKSKMRIEFKIMFFVILVLIPISGLIIYPLRYRLYRA
jgi:hypothetical protein